MVLVHQGERCSPDFDGLGLGGFDKFPEMYALVSVDADHADKVYKKNAADWFGLPKCPMISWGR